AFGMAAVPAAKLPTVVKLVHQGSGQELTFPLRWNGGGRSAVTTWNIPPAAKLGVYEVSLERPDAAGARPRSGGEGEGEGEGEGRQRSWSSGNFRVEEFRLPLVDARL